ncbi:MAG: PLP-dependent aminotransferase family protein [Marinovum sp.]|nr:PLP-dependent aminotransferase family protein [Marinovum sp.]
MNTIWRPSLSDFPGPKYKALASALRDGVQNGALPAGSRLPPVRDLAFQLSITPGTVARAYTILTDQGVFEATVGRGTFVAEKSAPGSPDISPIEVDATPHGSGGITSDTNLFSPALPNVGQAELIRLLMKEVAEDPPSGLMHYPNRTMFQPARQAVVTWLQGTPLGVLDESDVVLSHGGQNGISLVLQTILTGQKPIVLVEELSYPGFRRAAELLRAEVVPVPLDKDGIVPEKLDTIARATGAQVLCTSPEVHNPTGVFTPATRREAIVAVARARGFQVIEDDCYRMGVARAPTYRMLAPERGWYISSISKTLTPALRIGFAIAPHRNGAGLRRAAEHGFFGLATPLADLTAKLLSHPDVIPLSQAVTKKMSRYVQSCVNHLGAYELIWHKDAPFLWLVLPQGWRASNFCQAAAEKGIRVRPAEDFACRDARAPHAVRLAVNAQVPLERFDDAMAWLRRLLDNPPERIGV